MLNGANAAVAPDGTTTAEDYTFPATAAAESSGRYQSTAACGSISCAYTYYVKGHSGSGTLDLCSWGATASCTDCTYNPTTWTRCERVATISGSPGVFIGNSTANNGGTVRAANRVFVWGTQLEAGVAATSYVATAGTAVARTVERASFALTLPASATYSMMSTIVPPTAWRTAFQNRAAGTIQKDASNLYDAYITPALTVEDYIAGVAKTHTGPSTPNTPTRIGHKYDGTTLSACVGGSCTGTARAFTPIDGANVYYVGAYSGGTGYESNAWHGQICFSPLATGCLP